MPPDEWIFVFQALPSETPAPIRIRHLLKRALRDWGLKCVRMLPELPPDEEAEANVPDV